MRGALVMTMVMISPSRREVSPAEKLHQSPRLAPPRFRLVAAESRPERFSLIFFQGEILHIAEDGHRRPARWPTRQGARLGGGAPTLVSRVWAPWPSSLATIFFIYFKVFRGVSGLLELRRIDL